MPTGTTGVTGSGAADVTVGGGAGNAAAGAGTVTAGGAGVVMIGGAAGAGMNGLVTGPAGNAGLSGTAGGSEYTGGACTLPKGGAITVGGTAGTAGGTLITGGALITGAPTGGATNGDGDEITGAGGPTSVGGGDSFGQIRSRSPDGSMRGSCQLAQPAIVAVQQQSARTRMQVIDGAGISTGLPCRRGEWVCARATWFSQAHCKPPGLSRRG
ncbi:MAG: hypothetical protein WD738_20300 [Pirellulales bacterium]